MPESANRSSPGRWGPDEINFNEKESIKNHLPAGQGDYFTVIRTSPYIDSFFVRKNKSDVFCKNFIILSCGF